MFLIMATQEEHEQIIPKALYLNRRQFLKQAAVFGAGLTLASEGRRKVENPATDTISDLLDRIETVQRVSLLRSVEGYSMVLPWQSLLALGLVLAAAQHGFHARHDFAR